MLTMQDLLQDSRYKEFLCKVPDVPAHLMVEGRTPFRLYVLLKSSREWRHKDFATYTQAFKALKKVLPRAADATIHCGGFASAPPTRVVRVKGKYVVNSQGDRQQVTKLVTWKPTIPSGEFDEHYWCPYCRRPTVFDFFTRHHALPPRRTAGLPVDPAVLRCVICGASERIVNLRRK